MVGSRGWEGQVDSSERFPSAATPPEVTTCAQYSKKLQKKVLHVFTTHVHTKITNV